MAHSRKRKREFDSNLGNRKELKVEDVMCPVCRSIIIEPVSLPCNKHILCYYCFEKTIENNTLTCPICRKRIGSWLRAATKSRSLINSKLWLEIQEKFPEQVKKKQSGNDDGIEEEVTSGSVISQRLSIPGEIKKEFEEQLKVYSDELNREKEIEEKASVEFINKLLESEMEVDEVRKSELKGVLEKDESLARILQMSINKTVPDDKITDKTLNKVTTDNNLSRKSKQQKVTNNKVTMEKFVTRMRTNSLESTNSSSNSRNSIDSEFSHFKPIIREPKTPPKKLPDGSVLVSKPHKVQPLNLELSGRFDAPVPTLSPIKSPVKFSTSNGPIAFSRVNPSNTEIEAGNNEDSDTDFEDVNDPMMMFLSSPDPGPSTSSAIPQLPTTASVTCDASIQLYSVLEEQLRLRLKQEEQDRKFAEYLQNVWDSENGKDNSRSNYELRSRPHAKHSTASVTSVGRQTTLDKHVQPLSL